MSELHLVFVLVAFVIGFISGLIYALRLYKQIEANCDREWAKRQGMREMKPQDGEQPLRLDPSPPTAEIVRCEGDPKKLFDRLRLAVASPPTG